MPFKSEKQRKWMHANEPEMAKKWEKKKKKEEKLTEAGVNVWYFYKKANKDKKKFFKMLSDFRKKHSDTKWIKMLNYALKDFNENPKKYKTIDDKQNILFKNLQNNKKVYEGKLEEKAKRDYKDEYKKFQSSPKSKKYRAELNRYNRNKGTYGNGDGKDASHKGGKIAGFEKESVNRGRAEKSRLKKTSENVDMNEQKLREMIRDIIKESKLKPKQKISKKEWSKIKKFNKHIGQDGTHYVMQLTNKGTALVPVVVEGKLTEKPLKTNPKIWVSDKFDKVIDKLPFAKLTKANVIKLAKKFKVDEMDALRWVSYNQDVDFGLKEEKLTEGQEPLWTKETAKDAVNQVKKGLKNAVPYTDGIGTGFAGESIIGKISLDDKKTWSNNILENSRWCLIHIHPDGTLDTVRISGYGDYKTRKAVPILRKSKNKTLKQAIDRLGKYLTMVRIKYPDSRGK